MTIAVTRLQLNLLKAVEPGATTSLSFFSKSRRGIPSFSMRGQRNVHKIEITTTTTQHRDYPPLSEVFQLRSVGEPRRHDPESGVSGHRSNSRGRPSTRQGNGGFQSDAENDAVEMRAVLNSKGRVILKEVDKVASDKSPV